MRNTAKNEHNKNKRKDNYNVCVCVQRIAHKNKFEMFFFLDLAIKCKWLVNYLTLISLIIN